jgi:hypothetical protein
MDIDGFVFGAFDEMVFYTSAFDDTASCRTYQQYFRVAPGHRTLTEKPTVSMAAREDIPSIAFSVDAWKPSERRSAVRSCRPFPVTRESVIIVQQKETELNFTVHRRRCCVTAGRAELQVLVHS